MAEVIQLPARKILDYVSIHGHPSRWGWTFTQHYTDGSEQDTVFYFEDAEKMVLHFRKLTADRLQPEGKTQP